MEDAMSGGVLSRRDLCKIGAISATALCGGTRSQAAQTGETIVRSNRFLSIGLNQRTGIAFVEEKGSGETWIWDWRQVRAADLRSFSGDRKNLKALQPAAITPTPDGFSLDYHEAWGRFRGSVELAGAEVLFRVEPDVRYPCALGAVQFPSTLRPESDTRPVLLDTVNGGRLHRPGYQAANFSIPADVCWMRYYGVLGGKSAYLCIVEPGFDAELQCEDEKPGPLRFGWIHTPRLGIFEQARTARFRFLSSPSYVMVARAYRRYAMDEGLYRSLREKLTECPSLEKLFGGVLVMIGYLHDEEADYAGAFRQLKKAGVERAYVYPVGYFNFNGSDEVYPGYRSDFKWIHLGPDVLAELRRLDYLFAPWIWVNEIAASSPYLDSLALRQADGTRRPGWRVGRVQWYDSHEGRVLEMLRQAAPQLRAQYNAAHFDVLNAGTCLESFGAWSYDRRTDAGYRNAMFAEFSTHDRVVGCEQNKDWALPYKHFGTNKQPGPYGKNAPYWPVPLWQLAFHDSMMTSWWEHSTYNDPDLGHDMTGREIRRRMLLDILTGDLPSICPVGRQVAWRNPGGADREMFDFRYKLDDSVTLRAIDAAVQVARFNALHATDDLVHHEFLSEGRDEQQTSYASGTRVKVRLPRNIEDPGELRIS
jgi:hypothetical protein